MAELHSKILLNTVERMPLSDINDPVSTTSRIFAISHPRPGEKIGIVRVLGRLHVHNPVDLRLGANEFTLTLFRASDFSLMGGAVFETARTVHHEHRLVSVDRDTYWAPHYFELAAADSLIAVMEAFGDSFMVHITVGGFIAIAYALVKPNGELE